MNLQHLHKKFGLKTIDYMRIWAMFKEGKSHKDIYINFTPCLGVGPVSCKSSNIGHDGPHSLRAFFLQMARPRIKKPIYSTKNNN